MARLIVGNWKMNLTWPEAEVLARAYVRVAEDHPMVTLIMTPSHTWLLPTHDALRMKPQNLYLASQAVSPHPHGAYTGDISAEQVKGIVTYSLVGHSERRQYHHEQGSIIADQITNLIRCGITPIVCFGEVKQSTQAQMASQLTRDLANDLHGLANEAIEKCIFAYEPLWAIGTGNPAQPPYIETVISHVKKWFTETYGHTPKILYGGSVTEENAGALGLIHTMDGLLVGGASLQGKHMHAICTAFTKVG